MGFFRSLFSGDDVAVDSVIVGGFMSLVTLIGLTAYAAYQHPELFSPITFATGSGAIIGLAGGTKTARDRLSQPDDQNPAKAKDDAADISQGVKP